MVSRLGERKSITQLLIIAGIPRSGTTWLFNAVRLVCETLEKDTYGSWFEDYDPHNTAKIHILKVHKPADAPMDENAITLTVHRDMPACLASQIRMGWLDNSPEKVKSAARHWTTAMEIWIARAAYVASYEKILTFPATVVRELGVAINAPLDEQAAAAIAIKLNALKAPEQGAYDPKTLMHPHHRSDSSGQAKNIDDIRQLLAEE